MATYILHADLDGLPEHVICFKNTKICLGVKLGLGAARLGGRAWGGWRLYVRQSYVKLARATVGVGAIFWGCLYLVVGCTYPNIGSR